MCALKNAEPHSVNGAKRALVLLQLAACINQKQHALPLKWVATAVDINIARVGAVVVSAAGRFSCRGMAMPTARPVATQRCPIPLALRVRKGPPPCKVTAW